MWVIDKETGMRTTDNVFNTEMTVQLFEDLDADLILNGVSVTSYTHSAVGLIRTFKLPKDTPPPISGVHWLYVEPGVWVAAQ